MVNLHWPEMVKTIGLSKTVNRKKQATDTG